MHCKAFETLIRTVHVSVNQCPSPFDLPFTLFFFSVNCLSQRFVVRMPSFLSYYWIPAVCVNDATVAVLLKCFALISLGRVQTLIL